jgi:outer membrane biosynthesis protein TonB
MGMLGAMGILKSFTDELRKVQAEREAQLLLEVLRRRLGDLTFGDLAALITSPLGKKLASVKVSEAFAVATASAPTVVTTPGVEETRTSPVAPKAAKSSSKKASKSSRAKPDRKAKGKAAKPSNPREPKAAKAERSAKKSTKKTAEKKTTKALASAKPATTPSSAAEGRKGAAAASTTPPQATGPREVSARTAAGRIAYDDSIVAALREAGDWISGTALRAKVGGSRDQLRFGLSRLATEGMITRIGERDATRYKLIG